MITLFFVLIYMVALCSTLCIAGSKWFYNVLLFVVSFLAACEHHYRMQKIKKRQHRIVRMKFKEKMKKLA